MRAPWTPHLPLRCLRGRPSGEGSDIAMWASSAPPAGAPRPNGFDNLTVGPFQMAPRILTSRMAKDLNCDIFYSDIDI